MKFLASKTAAVQCVSDLLLHSDTDWQSIMITRQGTYEGCCVLTVTVMSSEDIEKKLALSYLDVLMNTSSKNTKGG